MVQNHSITMIVLLYASYFTALVRCEVDPERREQWYPQNNHWPKYQPKTYIKHPPKNTWMYHAKPPPMYHHQHMMAGVYKQAMAWNKGGLKATPKHKWKMFHKGFMSSKKSMYAKGVNFKVLKKHHHYKKWYQGKGKGMQNNCMDCSADCIGVQEFLLIDAVTDEPLMTIMPNDVLDVAQLEQMFGPTDYAIECVTFGQVASAVVSDNFGTTNVDNTLPWTLSGDQNGDYFRTPFEDNLGSWRVTCQPFCELDGVGETSGAESIDFQFIVPTPTPVPPPTTPSPISPPTTPPPTACTTCRRGCIFVTGFALVDTSINTGLTGEFFQESILQEINNGDTLDLSDLRDTYGQNKEFTIVCLTNPRSFGSTPFIIGSAGMRDNFASNELQNPLATSPSDAGYYNVENFPPFTLADDDSGAYYVTDFDNNTGDWEVTCQAFCEINLGYGSGVDSQGRPNPAAVDASSDPVTVSFTVRA